MKTIKQEVAPGDTIYTACREAVEVAQQELCNVEFVFNGHTITATPRSKPDDLVKHFLDECDRKHAEYIASPEYKRQMEECERKQREKENAVKSLLSSAPPNMALKDSEGWKKCCEANSDGYGKAVIDYAEQWARIMEARMANGEQLGNIADECSHIADTDGITGFMYGCAVSILSKVWKHGEELRLWHNIKTQIHKEGENANASGTVLNPAVLTVG